MRLSREDVPFLRYRLDTMKPWTDKTRVSSAAEIKNTSGFEISDTARQEIIDFWLLLRECEADNAKRMKCGKT